MSPEQAASNVEISDLTVYPVKAMKGISLNSAVLEAEGLQHDRRFMVVRSNGEFVTQRDTPRLALVETRLQAKGVELSLDGQGRISLPLEAVDGERIETAVWGDPCETIDQGEDISRWLTAALQSEEMLRVVRMAAGFTRPQTQPELLGAKPHTHFADAAPLLVANLASLEALNGELLRRGEQAVPMNRFRPNITISGLSAFREHAISGLSGQNFRLRFCHPCQRCKVTTIDQETAVRHPHWQPYKTLGEINPMPDSKRAPAFGQNAIVNQGFGATISVGDRLQTEGSKA